MSNYCLKEKKRKENAAVVITVCCVDDWSSVCSVNFPLIKVTLNVFFDIHCTPSLWRKQYNEREQVELK